MTVMKKIVRRAAIPGPIPDERRLPQRALLYWHGLLRDRKYVTFNEFDPLFLEDRSSQGFMLTLGAEPVFSHIGPFLHKEAGLSDRHITFDDVPSDSLLGHFAGRYQDAERSRKPLVTELEFRSHAGLHLICRGALLPLSSNGVHLDHVYGVVNWKTMD